jgi:ABC-2 type transport system ATP-binding protein
MSEPAIETFSLTKYYDGLLAVEKLSLKVPQGSIFGLVGPDGAGKSTVIKMLATIIPPSSGKAKVAGFDLVKEKHKIRENVGYMSEEFTLYQDLSVLENLIFFADVFGVSPLKREQKLKELLAFSRLEPFANRRAQYLSGGMKQKLALACTLIHEPQILLLDEPTRGVDPISRREFWRIITDLNQKGMTILISTPYMDEAERCNQVAFLHQGSLLVVDEPQKIKQMFEGGLFKVQIEAVFKAKKIVEKLNFVEDAEIFGHILKVVLKDKKDVNKLKKALQPLGRAEIEEAPLDLEAAFIFLMKQTLSKHNEFSKS